MSSLETRCETPATNDSQSGKIYINTPSGSSPNASFLDSQNYFTDELLVALEKAGKSLREIESLILPFDGVNQQAIVIDGCEFYNDDDPSTMAEKKARIRELLDASYEEKARISQRVQEAEHVKNELRQKLIEAENQRQSRFNEKQTAAARLKLLSLTARDKFGITKSRDGFSTRKRQREAEIASSIANNTITGVAEETGRHKRVRVSKSSDKSEETSFQQPQSHGKAVKEENIEQKIKAEPGIEFSHFAAQNTTLRDNLNSEASEAIAAPAISCQPDVGSAIQGVSNCVLDPSPTHLATTPVVSESMRRPEPTEVRPSIDDLLGALPAPESPPKTECTSVPEVGMELDAGVGTGGESYWNHENTSASNLDFIAGNTTIDNTAANGSVQLDLSNGSLLSIPRDQVLPFSWSKRVVSADLDDDDKSSEEAVFTDSSHETESGDSASHSIGDAGAEKPEKAAKLRDGAEAECQDNDQHEDNEVGEDSEGDASGEDEGEDEDEEGDEDEDEAGDEDEDEDKDEDGDGEVDESGIGDSEHDE